MWNTESYLETHRGTLTSHAPAKMFNRLCECEIDKTERLSSLSYLLGSAPYPIVELWDCWRKILFNQFHDILAGSSIPEVYKDAYEEYSEAITSLRELQRTHGNLLTSWIDTRTPKDVPHDALPFVIFNPLNWDRDLHLELDGDQLSVWTHDGRELPTQTVATRVPEPTTDYQSYSRTACTHNPPRSMSLTESSPKKRKRTLVAVPQVPGMGYSTVFVQNGRAENIADTTSEELRVLEHEKGLILESSRFTVIVDRQSGDVLSIRDHALEGSELLSGPANRLAAWRDLNPKDDAWDLHDDYLERPLEIPPPSRVTVTEKNGPLRIAVRCATDWDDTTLIRELELYESPSRLNFRTYVDWHKRHVILKVLFPFALDVNRVTCETAYGAIDRCSKSLREGHVRVLHAQVGRRQQS